MSTRGRDFDRSIPPPWSDAASASNSLSCTTTSSNHLLWQISSMIQRHSWKSCARCTQISSLICHTTAAPSTRWKVTAHGTCSVGRPSKGNPAARAAHAAFAIMQAAKGLELPVPEGWALQFRVTIASDLMVIMATEHEGEVEVAGKAINLAARLKRVCQPGSIVIDRATRDRLGRAFHVAALGLQSFEGIEGEVEAFELGEPRAGLTTFAAQKYCALAAARRARCRNGGSQRAVGACV